MKVLSGVYPHGEYTGDIEFEDEPCRFSGIRDSEQRGIVIIHQELALSPYLSIAENIYLGNERRGRFGLIDWNRTNADAATLLERVGLKENPVTPAMDLGVGKQQLVEIAKALSKRVKLLILDEPTAALNDADSAHLLHLLRGLRDEGITCVIISHKLNEIRAIADTTTILRDGRTIETLDMGGDVPRTASSPGWSAATSTTGSPTASPTSAARCCGSRTGPSTPHPARPGRRGPRGAHPAPRRDRRARGPDGRGPDGAGDERVRPQLRHRDHRPRLQGRREITVRTVTDAIRHGLAYATEDRKTYGLNLIEDVKRNISAAGLRGLARGGWVNDNREYEVAERFRKEMNIKTPSVLSPTGQLSGGNQQKVVLSKWIFTDADVLILDEPTRGIDVGAKYEIYSIINRMADQGRAVLVISSELPELIGICDRLYAMAEGRITGEVSRADATPERLMQYMTQTEESTA